MCTDFRVNIRHHFSGINIRQLADRMVVAYFIFEGLLKCFPDSTILHSHQQCMSNPVSSDLFQHLVLSLFWPGIEGAF